jgi:hypothetical protein
MSQRYMKLVWNIPINLIVTLNSLSFCIFKKKFVTLYLAIYNKKCYTVGIIHKMIKVLSFISLIYKVVVSIWQVDVLKDQDFIIL